MNTIIKMIAVLLLAGLVPGQLAWAQITNINPPSGFLLTQPISVTFEWTPLALPTLTHDYYYTLSIYRVGLGQTVSQAMANNTPVYVAHTINVTEHTYSFTYDYAGKGRLVWRVCGFRQEKKKGGIKPILNGIPLGGGTPPGWPTKPIEVCGKPSMINVNMAPPAQPAVNCLNSGFEEGDLSEWEFATGTFGSVTTNGIVNGRHTLMTTGDIDPNIPGLSVIPPGGGSFSLRLGNANAGAQSESATFSYIVDATNQFFNYNFAVVLQDPNHAANQQPFFQVEIFEEIGGNEVLIDQLLEISNVNNGNFFQNSNGLSFRDWDCNPVDLSDHIGDEVFFRFTTADCSLGAHFGYAYIDMLCSSPTENLPTPVIQMDDVFCLGDPIFADFSSTTLASEHVVAVFDIATGTGVDTLISGVPSGNFDIFDFFTQSGFQFQCGMNYQVNLIAQSECANSSGTTHVFRIADCPTPNVIPNGSFCEDAYQAGIPIGGPAIPGATYSWTPASLLINSTSANPTIAVMPNDDQSFQVVMTTADGCISSSVVMVSLVRTPVPLISVTEDRCFHHLHATLLGTANFNLATITWTNDQNGNIYTGADVDISKEDPTATYTATVTVMDGGITCTSSNTITLTQDLYFYYDWVQSDLSIPTSFTPNGDGLNDFWFITDAIGPAQGIAPAYNATEAIVRVFDRWGNGNVQLFEQHIFAPPGGFTQGSLGGWDGKHNGILQNIGVYVFYIQLKNCNGVWTDPAADLWKGSFTLIL